jgi:peptide/nickel transport system permease protein
VAEADGGVAASGRTRGRRGGVARLIAIRCAMAVVTLVAVTFVVYFGMALMPGDAAQAVLGREATPERLELLRQQYGLDQGLLTQYLDWLSGLVRGDLGTSLASGQPVWDLVGDKLRNTAVLALCALLLLVPLSVGLGVLSALWRDRWADHGVTSVTLLLVSTPEFVFGTLLIVVFSFGLGVLPAASLLDGTSSILAQWKVLVLPVLTLVAVAVAQATRMIRATMIEVLHEDYIEVAALRGVPRRRILLRHALPNALDSTIQVLALTVGWLVAGVVVTETLFQFPGIGSAFADAVRARDLPTVQAVALIVTAVYVFANLIGEIAMIALNPRLRRRLS